MPNRSTRIVVLLRTLIRSFAPVLVPGLSLGLVAACNGPQPDSASWPIPDDTRVLLGGRVVDVESGTAGEPVAIAIAGNRIVAVVPAEDFEAPEGFGGPGSGTVLDVSGTWIIPGLWDMHAHALQEGVYERMFPMFIANGVTGIRDMNGPMPLSEIHELRRRVLGGEVLGPRFVSPGPLLDGPGRGGDALGPQVRWVATPEEARDTVRALAARGADFIKPYNRLTPELYEAVMDEAHRIGIPVMGHVPLSVDPFVAARAGQASVEHLGGVLEGTSTEGPELLAITRALLAKTVSGEATTPDDAARLFAARRAVVGTHDPSRAAELYAAYVENGVRQCPTLVSNRAFHLVDFEDSYRTDPRLRFIPASAREEMAQASFLGAFGNPPESFMRERWREMREAVGEMYRAGVPILAGTDTGAAYTYAGFSLHDELGLLVEAGLPPAAALRAATLEPARLLGATDSLGTVAAGKVADLVILEANPLADIGNTRRIRAVIANGHLFARPGLDALLDRAQTVASGEDAAAGPVH